MGGPPPVAEAEFDDENFLDVELEQPEVYYPGVPSPIEPEPYPSQFSQDVLQTSQTFPQSQESFGLAEPQAPWVTPGTSDAKNPEPSEYHPSGQELPQDTQYGCNEDDSVVTSHGQSWGWNMDEQQRYEATLDKVAWLEQQISSEPLKVVRLTENAKLPSKSSRSKVALDLFSATEVLLPALGRPLVSTDLLVTLPPTRAV